MNSWESRKKWKEKMKKKKRELISYVVYCWGHCRSPYCLDAACFCVDIWPKKDLPMGRAESIRFSIIVISYKEGQQKRVIIKTGRMSWEVAIRRWRRHQWARCNMSEQETEINENWHRLWDWVQSWLPTLQVSLSVGPTVFCPQSLVMHELTYHALPNTASLPNLLHLS